MGSNILGIGQSALAAAQLGIATTGHNIANASTVGYNRQVLSQSAAAPQSQGDNFVGQGTKVDQIARVYNEFLGQQVNNSQSTSNQVSTYLSQISQINNLVADASAGVSPALQDFFKSVQNLAASPNGSAGAAARQSTLSSAQALVSRFAGLQNRIDEIRNGVNSEIQTTVGTINSYASQISELNKTIEKAQSVSSGGAGPNDLLDQRDQLVTELSKLTKVSVVKQGAKFNVFIGSGQALVVGDNVNTLAASPSLTDPSRLDVAYVANGKSVLLSENSLPGGKLGGLFDFRSTTLDVAQNSLGRVATTLATTFNSQHKLGQDLNGQLGGNFFNVAAPVSSPSSSNTSTAGINATITNASALTTSDYRLQFDGTNYKITRLSDSKTQTSPTLPLVIDGVTYQLAPPPAAAVPAAGDEFLIKPTVNGAAGLSVAISDTSKIAAAGPTTTAAPSTNTGNGKISPSTVDSTYTLASLAIPVKLAFSANAFTGFPAGSNVTVTNNGVTTSYAPYVVNTPVAYTSGATISFSGVSFTVTGTPQNGDAFTVSQNTNGSGDSRNAVSLAALQTANTVAGNTTSYQGAYAQFVSLVGNKTHELEVTGASETKLLAQSVQAQQSQSGVNLDEEAANLLRYQQAYQAAGKLMQIAGQLFEVLLSIK
ncbi:flagellar hook-associated protein FlgK [Undibacterium sp. Jales W-56]|uniref:flagellar hook-associated protein FlgK n=1 Tax=Undibacterium sp. Jales W-56 TaxID=2897325 RepID=UPI0021CF45A4|nr:flagellar hook-associated protein FlgK [Undibacterium sp. Jales W-56]MCU6433227.1 flagellar hook-associated protein FlgK [Undibacterium sp. Jales W-56]